MNSLPRATIRWLTGLGLLSCSLVLLTFIGCAKDEAVRHIFVGAEPEQGTVQIATNAKIPVMSVDAKSKNDANANYEERDCGQMVLEPRWVYERHKKESAELDRYRAKFGLFLDPTTREPVGPDPDEPAPEKSGVLLRLPSDSPHAEIIKL